MGPVGVPKFGWAVLACAALNGVEPAELADASAVDDIVVIEQDSIVEHVRRLSTNSTGDGLSTASIVSIVVGGVAGAILIIGLVWWTVFRKPPMYKPMRGSGGGSSGGRAPYGEINVPDARNIPPDFFRASAGGAANDHVEMPLLRLAPGQCNLGV